jgi:hypothetical protein
MTNEPITFQFGALTMTLPAPPEGAEGWLLGNERAMYYAVDLQGNVTKLDEPIHSSPMSENAPISD